MKNINKAMDIYYNSHISISKRLKIWKDLGYDLKDEPELCRLEILRLSAYPSSNPDILGVTKALLSLGLGYIRKEDAQLIIDRTYNYVNDNELTKGNYIREALLEELEKEGEISLSSIKAIVYENTVLHNISDIIEHLITNKLLKGVTHEQFEYIQKREEELNSPLKHIYMVPMAIGATMVKEMQYSSNIYEMQDKLESYNGIQISKYRILLEELNKLLKKQVKFDVEFVTPTEKEGPSNISLKKEALFYWLKEEYGACLDSDELTKFLSETEQEDIWDRMDKIPDSVFKDAYMDIMQYGEQGLDVYSYYYGHIDDTINMEKTKRYIKKLYKVSDVLLENLDMSLRTYMVFLNYGFRITEGD